MVTGLRTPFVKRDDLSESERKTRVLCGNCGCWYNAPEQEHEHGIGKCGIMPGGRPVKRGDGNG